MALVKDKLRSTIGDARMNALVFLSTKNSVVVDCDLDAIAEKFVSDPGRRHYLMR